MVFGGVSFRLKGFVYLALLWYWVEEIEVRGWWTLHGEEGCVNGASTETVRSVVWKCTGSARYDTQR